MGAHLASSRLRSIVQRVNWPLFTNGAIDNPLRLEGHSVASSRDTGLATWVASSVVVVAPVVRPCGRPVGPYWGVKSALCGNGTGHPDLSISVWWVKRIFRLGREARQESHPLGANGRGTCQSVELSRGPLITFRDPQRHSEEEGSQGLWN